MANMKCVYLCGLDFHHQSFNEANRRFLHVKLRANQSHPNFETRRPEWKVGRAITAKHDLAGKDLLKNFIFNFH